MEAMSQLLFQSKILIVDPSLGFFLTIKAHLFATQVEIHEAQSEETALVLCQELNFAVIVLDLESPTMDSVGLAWRLRGDKSKSTQNTPILFVTSQSMDSQRVMEAYAVGGLVDMLPKPLHTRSVQARLRPFLELHVNKLENNSQIKQFLRALNGTLLVAEEMHIELNRQKDLITQANAFTESIINSMGDAVIVLSSQGCIQKANEPACQLLAHSESKLKGMNIDRFLSGDILTAIQSNEEVLICTKSIDTLNTDAICVEGDLVSQDGCKIPLLVSTSTLHDPERGKSGIILVAKDITEYKKTQEALREKDRLLLAAERKASLAKDRFLAHISHEIRTPMNAILGLTDQVLQTSLPDLAKNHLAQVMNSARLLLRIIDDILDFSRLDVEELKFEIKEFHLRDLLKHLLEMFRLDAGGKALELRTHISQACPEILVGDPFRLEQILMYLVGNAVKFTQAGHVTLEVEFQEEEASFKGLLEITVADTGIGMSPQHLAGLFQPFVQVDNSSSRKYGGTGLGLVICKNVVEKMGGTLEVNSIQGRGSRFKFAAVFGLPSEHMVKSGYDQGFEDPVDEIESLRKVILETIAGAQVLVVEDNRINQQVIEEILVQLGLQVHIASDGYEAIHMVQQVAFDLIFMDIQMPQMDGYTATRSLRRLPGERDWPIVAVTAHTDSREKCLEAGMNDQIAKPIDKKLFYKTLLQWIPPRSQTGLSKNFQYAPKTTNGSLPLALPGLALKEGVTRLGGNEKLYRSLLSNFAKEFSASASEISTHLFQNNLENLITAGQLTHSIKGIAGSLAAYDLEISATAMERGIQENQREAWPALLEHLTQALGLVLGSIALLEKEQSVTELSVNNRNDVQMKGMILELTDAIRNRRFKAKSLLSDIKKSSDKTLRYNEVDLLEKSIDNYNFDEAWSHLQELTHRWGIEIT